MYMKVKAGKSLQRFEECEGKAEKGSHVRAPWIVGMVRYRCTMAWLTAYTDIQVKKVPMVTPNTVCRSAGFRFMLQEGYTVAVHHIRAPIFS